MTKKEIIYTIYEKLGIATDDTHMSEELISSLIDTKRAMLLKQQYAKNGWHMPTEIKQELCMDVSLVEKVSGYTCAGKILSTSIPLPRSIKIKGKEGPLMVRKSDSTVIALNIIPVERVPFLFSNRFTQHLNYCAVDMDGKLILISNNNEFRFLKSIKVTDIFEQPDTVHSLACDTPNVEPWDLDYPVEVAMVDVITDLVVKELTRSLGIPEDRVNDATDERK